MATCKEMALAVAAVVILLGYADSARPLANIRSLVQLVEPMGAGKTFGTLQGAPGGSKYGALQHQQATDGGSADGGNGASGNADSAGGLDNSGSSSATGSTTTSPDVSSSTFNTGSPVPMRRDTPNPTSDPSQSNADSTDAASNNPF